MYFINLKFFWERVPLKKMYWFMTALTSDFQINQVTSP